MTDLPAEDELVVDLKTLKIREIEEIEEILGEAMDVAFAQGRPKGKALRAVGYILRRRDNPDFTLEDAGELVINLTGDSVPDPT